MPCSLLFCPLTFTFIWFLFFTYSACVAHLSEEDSTNPDAEVSQVDLSSSAAKSQLHALDEILFVESGALMPTSGGTSDIGGHQQKEVRG